MLKKQMSNFLYKSLVFSIVITAVVQPFYLSSVFAVTSVAPVEMTTNAEFRPGEVIVQFRDYDEPIKVHFDETADLESVSTDIAQRSDVRYAEPNYIYSMTAFDPNDPYYPQQWYLRQIGMPVAWEISTGAPDVVVAVLDSGVDVNHPDLKNNIWSNADEIAGDGIDNDHNGFTDDTQGWDFIEWTNDPRPSAVTPYSRTALHHGTLVAGAIAAAGNNAQGVAGVAWQTKIMPLRVLDRQGQGDVEQVAQAVDYAVNNGARVINLSFVGVGFSQRLYDSLRRAYLSGVLIVVASGNNSGDVSGDLDKGFLYPVCYDAADVNGENWILGVTATDTLDQHVDFANYGSRCIDIAAPGVNFVGAQVYDPSVGLTEPYGGSWSGTSLAAPLVSGAAALVMANERSLSAHDVMTRLLKSSDNISALNLGIAEKLGRGRLNVARALRGEVTGGPNGTVTTPAQGQIVVVPIGYYGKDREVVTASGQVSRVLKIPTRDFAAGGSAAVSENKRLGPGDGSVRLSGILRGDQIIALGEGSAGLGRVRLYDVAGTLTTTFRAYGLNYRGGVEVAAGDVSGTGQGMIVTVPTNGGPHVRIFDREGNVRGQFFAYDKSLRAGYDVAVADLNADGTEEIIVTSTTRFAPLRVFNSRGELIDEWSAFGNVWVGVRVAAGDLDGDGAAEIVVSPVGGRDIRIWSAEKTLLGQFPVFPVGFRGGVMLDVGDLDGNGVEEIIVAPAGLGGPQVRVFDGAARLLGQFFVYDKWLRGGLAVAVLR